MKLAKNGKVQKVSEEAVTSAAKDESGPVCRLHGKGRRPSDRVPGGRMYRWAVCG